MYDQLASDPAVPPKNDPPQIENARMHCQRKSLALRLTGLCLGIAGLIATNSLPAYKAQVEVAFLTALVCWFFGYDFWDYRNQPRFRAGVIAYSRSTP
ncbi:MAG: hypothetical protein JWP08_1601 [Bryobacterales bacterium]|jgi:hypothetical protein|nr:hypothetical protein [Bryobacterales bacterium]